MTGWALSLSAWTSAPVSSGWTPALTRTAAAFLSAALWSLMIMAANFFTSAFLLFLTSSLESISALLAADRNAAIWASFMAGAGAAAGVSAAGVSAGAAGCSAGAACGSAGISAGAAG